jgi:hypothetical protein
MRETSPLAASSLTLFAKPLKWLIPTIENTKSHAKHSTLTAVSDPRKGGCPAAV